jgi:hypothetical protein
MGWGGGMKKNCVTCDAEFEEPYVTCSPCRKKLADYQREWKRKNKDRLNAERRAKVREQLGIKYCITCDNEIPYENNMSYSMSIYCSHECRPSSQKEYLLEKEAKYRAKRGPKIYSEEEKQWFRDYYQRNKEKQLKQNKLRYDNRTEEQKEADRKNSKEWRRNMTQEQRDKRNTTRKKWRKEKYKCPEQREQKRQRDREWHSKNPHKRPEYYEEHRKNPIKVLHQRMSNAVRNALRHKGSKKVRPVFDLLDYTKDELREHLESYFTEESGYTWNNMSKWHIDHIRPVSSFDFDSTYHPDFKKCWALNNLQPLWAADNMSKGTKWDGVVA